MEHTAACKAESARIKAEHDAWVAKWPKACIYCAGAGAFGSNGDDFTPPDAWPCDACTEQGICARCGFHGLTEAGEGPCSNCGWNYDDAEPRRGQEGPCRCELEADAAYVAEFV